MKRTRWISGLFAALLIVGPFAAAHAQGKGHEKEHGAKKAQGRGVVKQETRQRGPQSGSVAKADRLGRGNSPIAADARGRDNKPEKVGKVVDKFGGEVERRGFRVFAASPKHGERLAGRAIARAASHGLSDDDFVISPVGRNVYILNRSGDLLVNLDEDRDLGVWRVVTERDRGKSGAPSFCRSGAGHPVWGRQWCIEKGFGLGDDQGVRWARAVDFDNVIFRRPVTATDLMARDVLAGLLGDIAFNRLATHAVTLGLVDPLRGRWLGEPTGGPRVLFVTSGTRPVAEVVDLNRDDRADLLLVAVRP